MRYGWCEKDILKTQQKLIQLIENENDETRKCYLLKVLDNTNKLNIFSYAPIDFSEKITRNEKLVSLTSAFLGENRYYNLVLQIYEELKPFEDTIDAINEALFGQNMIKSIPTHYLTHETTYSLLKEVYESLDHELNEYFTEIYNKRYRTTRFTMPQSQLLQPNMCEANTVFIDGIRTNYFSLNNVTGLRKLQNLAHESGHGVANLINPTKPYYNGTTFLHEVESLFLELVTLYKKGFDINEDETYLLLFLNICTYFDKAQLLSSHQVLYEFWEKNRFVTNPDYFRKLKQEYNFNRDDFNIITDTNIYDDGPYVICFAIAMELFYMYKKNPEVAIQRYKSFLKSPEGIDDLLFIQQNIDINSHLREETKIILDGTKLSLQKKGVTI